MSKATRATLEHAQRLKAQKGPCFLCGAPCGQYARPHFRGAAKVGYLCGTCEQREDWMEDMGDGLRRATGEN